MKINKDIIAKFSPCSDRFNNYLKHYSNFDGTIEEFLKLPEITYDDKVWVWVRIADKKQLITWAALCAKSVLHLFELKYPEDLRPRKAIEAALSGDADAATDAAYAAAYAYATAAAAHAAYAAYAAYDAAHATYAADAAAYAACAARATEEQQQKNLNFILEVL